VFAFCTLKLWFCTSCCCFGWHAGAPCLRVPKLTVCLRVFPLG
jgi:hypothetical protein